MDIVNTIKSGKIRLGIEFGSTRIKAVAIDSKASVLGVGTHDWENRLEDGIWTYTLDDIHNGLRAAYANLVKDIYTQYSVAIDSIEAIGVSAMMHGYLAFDKNDNQLTEFRTWRNTITGEAAHKLSDAFSVNIPQRWSVAHLYQAMLNKEKHIDEVAFLTTLAGYVHWKLSGEKVLGVGDASGMFPIDTSVMDYDEKLLSIFDHLSTASWPLKSILPKPLAAGSPAGFLTEEGARFLDPSGMLKSGSVMCPPEGDAGTGMVATNSIRKCTGNVSAGTSIFAMIVLEHPLKRAYPEIDVVTTPDGFDVAMVHCNNCSGELDAWVGLFTGLLNRLGLQVSMEKLYSELYEAALEGKPDADGMIAYNYLSGEHTTGLSEGRPLYTRTPESKLTLENFMRLQIMSMFATLSLGMRKLSEEGVRIDTILGHGGIFKTPIPAQRILAAALNTPVAIGESAGEGGAWGVAILASFMLRTDKSLQLPDYLDSIVFKNREQNKIMPDDADVAGYSIFVQRYQRVLKLEELATQIVEMD